MLIVLEGCDGTGKTTLAQFLSKLLGAEIIHCSTHTRNDYDFFRRIIDAAEHRNIIADRWCYGQFVYQEKANRPLEDMRTAERNLQDLEELMLMTGAKVILVDAPTQTIEKRLIDRGETLINSLSVGEIQERFRALKKHSLLNWIDYNTGGNDND